MSIPIKRPASAARLASLIIVCPLLAVPLEKPMLRIISPTSGIVVKPGQKVSFRITGSGIFTALEVVGEAMAGFEERPGKPPWVVSVEIPENTDPGLYSLTATGNTSETEVESINKVNIDVEPTEAPPLLFSQRTLVIPLGDCVVLRPGSPRGDRQEEKNRAPSGACGQNLFISGTYADGTNVTLNRSTKITFVSQAPSVAKVESDSALVGVSAGKTKLVISGKYTIDVTVLDRKR